MTQSSRSSEERLKERNQDFLRAKEIIFRHSEGPGDSVGIQEMIITQEGSVQMIRPSWIIELEETFEEKYGHDKGQKVFKEVITKLMIHSETVH
jgi:hypothetical protein